MAGTVAVIFEAESTVNTDAAPPNFTTPAPVNPEPWTVTLVPIVPEVGLNELIVGAAAAAGTAGTATPPIPTPTNTGNRQPSLRTLSAATARPPMRSGAALEPWTL
jgi:hypothetical protein